MDLASTTTYILPPDTGPDPLKPNLQVTSRRYTDPSAINEFQRPSIGRQLWALRNVLIVLLTPLILIPLPLVCNDAKCHCAYVILVMAVYWITEAVPIAATSLIPIFLFPMIGLLKARTVSATYLNDTSILLFGGLLVAVSIETSNFHKRIALGVLMLVGAEPKWLMAGLMLVTWFLSMWISNTATTAMMVPIAQAVLRQLKTTSHGGGSADHDHGEGEVCREANLGYEMDQVDNKSPVDEKEIAVNTSNGKVETQCPTSEAPTNGTGTGSSPVKDDDANHLRMCKALSLSVCYSANIGGIASLTGTAPNLVLKGQSDIIFRDNNVTSPLTFATWMVYGLPLSFITLIVLWIWMQTFFLRFKGLCSCFRRGSSDSDASRRVKAVIREEFRKLGPISFAQWCVMVLFGVLVVLWITRDLGGIGGWGDVFKNGFVSDSTPATFIGFFLFVCPAALPSVFCFRKPNHENNPQVHPILTWQDVHEKMPWSLYLILGAGFSLAKASEESGLSKWMGTKLQAVSELDPYLILLILCYIVCFATEVMSNTAITTLMMPIMAQLAVNLNVSPLFFMFPTALATSFAFMLPVATPPNAIVFSYGQVRIIDMCACGLFMNIVSVPFTILATATWGNSFFKFETLPDGFARTTANPLLNLTKPLP